MRSILFAAVLLFTGCSSYNHAAYDPPSSPVSNLSATGSDTDFSVNPFVGTPSMGYYNGGAPGTMTGAGWAALELNAAHALLTSGGTSTALVGSVGVSVAWIDSTATSNVTTSNGGTIVHVIPAVGGKRIYITGGNATNLGSVVHHVQFLDTVAKDLKGNQLVIADFQLKASGDTWNIQSTSGLNTVPDGGVDMKFTDGGGSVGDVEAVLNFIQK